MRLYDIESKFTTKEFACPCEDMGCVFGTLEEHIDPDLITKLNIMRIMYGKPMVVTSGARCEAYNKQKGGVENSAHLPHILTGRCRAVDILVKTSAHRYELITYALKAGFNRIGVANQFLHLDVAWDLPQNVIFDY